MAMKMKRIEHAAILGAFFLLISAGIIHANCDFTEFDQFIISAYRDPVAAKAMVEGYADKKGCGCQDASIGCLRVTIDDNIQIISRQELLDAAGLMPSWISKADEACANLPEGEEEQDRAKLKCYNESRESIGAQKRGAVPTVARMMSKAYISEKLQNALKRTEILDKGRTKAGDQTLEARKVKETQEIARSLCRTLDLLDDHRDKQSRLQRERGAVRSEQIRRDQESKSKELQLSEQVRNLTIQFERTAGKSFIRSEWCAKQVEESIKLPFDIQPTPTP